MRYTVLVNITNRKIQIIDNVENVVSEITECTTKNDSTLKLYDFSYELTDDYNNSIKHIFTRFEASCFMFCTDVNPISKDEQEMYHVYDTSNFDSIINFWIETYDNLRVSD